MTNNIPFECRLCGNNEYESIGFLRRGSLVPQKIFACKECGVVFTDPSKFSIAKGVVIPFRKEEGKAA